MAKQILKSVLIGILVGAVLFMAPFFLLKFFLLFLLIGAICRLWWGGKRRGRWNNRNNYAYSDHIRNMSEEEYKNYKEKWNGYNCGPQHYYGCGGYHQYNCDPKTDPSTNAQDTKEKTETKNDKTE